MAAATAETARVEAPAATTGQAAVAKAAPEVVMAAVMVPAVTIPVMAPRAAVPVGMQMVGEAGVLTAVLSFWNIPQHEVAVVHFPAAVQTA